MQPCWHACYTNRPGTGLVPHELPRPKLELISDPFGSKKLDSRRSRRDADQVVGRLTRDVEKAQTSMLKPSSVDGCCCCHLAQDNGKGILDWLGA